MQGFLTLAFSAPLYLTSLEEGSFGS